MARFFNIVNGREVFDNGVVRLWRCASCKWWLNWVEEKCSACGAPRDHNVSALPSRTGSN
jgi:hypothetical protein